jgi:hypothetical protein
MSLGQRVSRLEATQAAEANEEWGVILGRLSDDELIALDACYRQAAATGKPVTDYITPELEAALERVKR